MRLATPIELVADQRLRAECTGQLVGADHEIETTDTRTAEVEQGQRLFGEIEEHTVGLDHAFGRGLAGGERTERAHQLGPHAVVETTEHRDVRVELETLTADVELDDAHRSGDLDALDPRAVVVVVLRRRAGGNQPGDATHHTRH